MDQQQNGYNEPILGKEGILSIENQHFQLELDEAQESMSTDANVPDLSETDPPGEHSTGPRQFYPSKDDYRKERVKMVYAEAVCIGSIPVDILMSQEVGVFLKKAARFCVKSQTEDDGTSRAAVELQYGSVMEAQECYQGLTSLNLPSNIEIRFLYPEQGQLWKCDDIRDQADPHNSFIALNHDPAKYDGDVILAVIGIDESVTEANLLKVFPNAVQAYVPYSYVLETRKCYAYVEFASEKDLRKHAGKTVMIEGQSYETAKLKDRRTLDTLLEELGTNLKFKSSVRLQQLLEDSYHYLDADDTTDTHREELTKGVQNVKEAMDSIQHECEESKKAANKRKGSDRSDQGSTSSSLGSAKKHVPYQNHAGGDGLMGPAPPGFTPLNVSGNGIMGYPSFGFHNEDAMAAGRKHGRGPWGGDQNMSEQGYDGPGHGQGRNSQGFQGSQFRNRGAAANQNGFGFNTRNGSGFSGPGNGMMGDAPGMGNRSGMGNYPQGPMGNMGPGGGGGMGCMNSATNMGRNQGDRSYNNMSSYGRNNQNNCSYGGGDGGFGGFDGGYGNGNSYPNQGNQNGGFGGSGRHMTTNNRQGWNNNW